MTAPKDLSACTDQQLVDLFILEDDELAARELVNRYREDVVAVANDILGHVDGLDFDSVVHRAFINAFEALPEYQPELPFGAWLSTIARNVAIDRVRQRRRKERQHVALDDSVNPDTPEPGMPFQPLQVADRSPDPLLQAILSEKWDSVKRVIQTFSPRYREAMLQHIEGAPHAEIAKNLGVSVNTVHSYILRGRKRLERALPA